MGLRVNSELLEAARAFHAAGVCILPAALDGSKMPGKPWKHYQTERPSLALVEQWLTGDADGIGAVCGAVSGGLEMLELEGRALDKLGEIAEAATAAGLADLWARFTLGYCERSPSGGVHWLYLVDGEAKPNTRLARNTAGEVMIETRGEGGWTILAPSAGRTHPSGKPWELISGTPATIPTISAAERDELHSLLRAFDEYRRPEPSHNTSAGGPTPRQGAPDPFGVTQERPAGEVTPGDDYAARTTWRQILEPYGWRELFTSNGRTYWRRPGKDRGMSATTGGAADGVDRLFVFSTSAAPFETEVPYSKFGAHALLEHGGDYSAAARALAASGYGSRPDPFAVAAGVATSAPAATATGNASTADNASVADATGTLTASEPSGEQQTAFDALVAVEATKLRVRDAAAAKLRKERAGELPAPIIRRLDDLLAEPDEEANYRIDGLWPAGGRFLLAAQYKAGKTTLLANLIRSLVDGDDFLDRFKVQPFDGRIVLVDDELDVGMLRRWLREQGIVNTDRITVVSLRGRLGTFDILDEHVRAEWAARIRGEDAAIVLFDCLRPVLDSLGLDEARDAGRFLVAFDNLLGAAGVPEGGVVHHAGHSGERSRGDSRLRDWPDVEWLLVREKDENGESEAGAARAFRAYGRDVDFAETILVFDPASRRLRLGEGNRKEFAVAREKDAILRFIGANPESTGKTIEDASEEIGVGQRKIAGYLKGWREQEFGVPPIVWTGSKTQGFRYGVRNVQAVRHVDAFA
jgi:hypothetical protein